MSEKPDLSLILEAAIMASSRPLTIEQLAALFPEDHRPDGNEIRAALAKVSDACQDRAFELKQVASGFRFQVRQAMAPWIGGLWDEKPQRYTRALLETLALIAYRQPITRGEIEEIRGVSVSSNIIRTLQEREWVRVVGHRDAPGRPAMFATTRQFLDYFNLLNLNELPPLSEIRDLEEAARALEVPAAVPEAHAENGTLAQPELADQEVIRERSARELFDELDAMEAELPTGFDDLIKKQKIPAPVLEKPGAEPTGETLTVPRESQTTDGRSSEETHSSASEEPDEFVPE
ncbi:SMC-Scp complex subunit ScpB [Endozoicomonas sp. ONNA2]|uniref:SMC-Scp complex subunit ScpB n=1 Tax=Endozoicomonas sp. ONNA2 TaxID=2828741 RepID=UPI002148D427|nr:SMC-Scp complex subunit ScpB [Endozoicomonas sp. ONNA2]